MHESQYRSRATGSTLLRAIGVLHVLVVLGCVAFGWASAAQIENEFLAVSFGGGSVLLHCKALDRPFIPRAVFPSKVEASIIRSNEDLAWGKGQELLLTHVNGWTTAIRLYPGEPFAHMFFIAGNRTTQSVTKVQAPLLSFDFDLGIPIGQVRLLGTGGVHSVAGPTPESLGSYSWSAIADPATRNGIVTGFVTHDTGIGVIIPDTSGTVSVQSDFGQFRVKPGQQRPVDTVAIGFFADARLGLEAYADSVAKHYRINLPPKPGVYCTWYHAGSADEAKVAANTQFAAENLRPYGLTVMQIDGGWQRFLPRDFAYNGDPEDRKKWKSGPIKVFADSSDGTYPKGMAHTAKKITSHGMVPGIWFMPFAGNMNSPYFDHDIFAKTSDGAPFHFRGFGGTSIDLTHPKSQAFVTARVKRIHGWGYRYLKMDGLFTGLACKSQYANTNYRDRSFDDSRLSDPDETHISGYRKGLQIVRENAPGTFILGCNVSQNMFSMGGSFGLIDAMRIGPDNGAASHAGNAKHWKHTIIGAWHGTNLYFLNGRVWHNDPDPVYVRETTPARCARLMCSWMAVAGAMHTSSMQYADLPPERLDILKRCLPSHTHPARPVDLFEATPYAAGRPEKWERQYMNQARIWLTGNSRMNVIGLFNWQDDAPDTIVYDMGRLGLDGTAEYVGFDFWADRFVESIQGTLKQRLPAGSCRVLAVRQVADHPQVVSTSRHITQGLMDVIEERWDSATRTLNGKSRVVAGDAYEIRISLPSSGNWEVKSSSLDGKAAVPSKTEKGGLRARFQPEKGGTVDWEIGF